MSISSQPTGDQRRRAFSSWLHSQSPSFLFAALLVGPLAILPVGLFIGYFIYLQFANQSMDWLIMIIGIPALWLGLLLLLFLRQLYRQKIIASFLAIFFVPTAYVIVLSQTPIVLFHSQI